MDIFAHQYYQILTEILNKELELRIALLGYGLPPDIAFQNS
jgi:hypothetical protein